MDCVRWRYENTESIKEDSAGVESSFQSKYKLIGASRLRNKLPVQCAGQLVYEWNILTHKTGPKLDNCRNKVHLVKAQGIRCGEEQKRNELFYAYVSKPKELD